MKRASSCITYDELINYVYGKFKHDFGQKKFDKIYKEVMNSKKVDDLIQSSLNKNVVPGGMDFLACLNSTFYFAFSKASTQIVGCLIALEKWNVIVNIPNRMISDEDLLNKAKWLVTEGKNSFFPDYHEL